MSDIADRLNTLEQTVKLLTGSSGNRIELLKILGARTDRHKADIDRILKLGVEAERSMVAVERRLKAIEEREYGKEHPPS